MSYLFDSEALNRVITALEKPPGDFTFINGSSASEEVRGSSGDDILFGRAGSDVIRGFDGDDVLIGFYLYEDEISDRERVQEITRDDQDVLYGGRGNDIYLNDSWVANTPQIYELPNEGIDLIYGGDGGSYTIPENVENFINDTTVTNNGEPVWVEIFGNSSNNYISTSEFQKSSTEEFHGLGGDDQFLGGGGDDRFYGGTGTDTAIYRFNSSAYSIVNNADGSISITYVGANNESIAEGKDFLFEVEYAQFSNERINLSELAESDDTSGSLPVTDSPKRLLYAGEGNEVFNGSNASIDILIFSASYANHSLQKSGDLFLVTDKFGAGGTDLLEDIDRLSFSDISIALDFDGATSAGGIYRLYKATFNREPDTGGLGYWIAQADAGTKDAVRMAEDFAWSQEFQNLYGITTTDNYGTGTDVSELVTGFYENVLGRTPDQGGLDFYTGVIESKERTVGRVLAEISDSQENYDGTIELIANGIVFDPWVG